jgi:hypothetical protein
MVNDPRSLTNYSISTFNCRDEDPTDASTLGDSISMVVNSDIINYFSQPQGGIDPQSFPSIYCLNPLKDDDCPVGICPNPDIDGLLVRIASMFPLFHK